MAGTRSWLLAHGLHVVTAADKAVLDAMAAAPAHDLEYVVGDVDAPRGWMGRAFKAELARRKAAR